MDLSVTTKLAESLLSCGQHVEALVAANLVLKRVKLKTSLLYYLYKLILFYEDNQSSEVLLIKAQILFDNTDFEHSLLYFCRALKISPRSKCARDGVNKCHKTIKNKLPKTTFRISNLSKILRELKTLGVDIYLRNTEQIKTRSTTLTHKRGKQLNMDYMKIISMEKHFLERTRNKCKIF